MKNSVKNTTLKFDFCINCGICKAVCPVNAINLKTNSYGENIPHISKSCTDCGLCTKYCPNTKDKLKSLAVQIAKSEYPRAFGLENSKYYLTWNPLKDERIKSASGGFITKFAQYLLSENKIDAVIHVERIFSKRKESHYEVCISRTPEDIARGASSAYQPVDFSDVLQNPEDGKTYFITGTPCVINAITNLKANHPRYKKINFITCALICSHNVNYRFNDYIADKHKISQDAEYAVNMRNKDDIPDANNFNNHFYSHEKDLLKMNRFESGWTNAWRSYYFAINVCSYCPDFWGHSADISVKDAWGEWAVDPLGKSIIVVRNKTMDDLLKTAPVVVEELCYDTMKDHQWVTSEYKQLQAMNKLFKSPVSKSNRRNGLLKNLIISKSSKLLYRTFSFKVTQSFMKKIQKLSERLLKNE